MPLLVRRRHQQHVVCFHSQSVVLRRRTDGGHVVKLIPEILGGSRDVLKPVAQVCRHVDAAEVQVAGAVAEPTSHLHQAVVHPRRPKEVAAAQAFERQAARELVAADRDHVQPAGFGVAVVVERLCDIAVDQTHLDGLDRLD